MSDEHGGNPDGGSGMDRRAFIRKMAVAGFAVPAVVTLADEGTAMARVRPRPWRWMPWPWWPWGWPTTTCRPTTTAAPITTPPITTTPAITTTPPITTTPAITPTPAIPTTPAITT